MRIDSRKNSIFTVQNNKILCHIKEYQLAKQEK